MEWISSYDYLLPLENGCLKRDDEVIRSDTLQNWGCSSVVESLPGLCKPSSPERKEGREGEKKGYIVFLTNIGLFL